MNKIGDCFKLTNNSYGRVSVTFLKILKFKLNHIVFECYAEDQNFRRSEVVIGQNIHNSFFKDCGYYKSITADEYDIERIR